MFRPLLTGAAGLMVAAFLVAALSYSTIGLQKAEVTSRTVTIVGTPTLKKEFTPQTPEPTPTPAPAPKVVEEAPKLEAERQVEKMTAPAATTTLPLKLLGSLTVAVAVASITFLIARRKAE